MLYLKKILLSCTRFNHSFKLVYCSIGCKVDETPHGGHSISNRGFIVLGFTRSSSLLSRSLKSHPVRMSYEPPLVKPTSSASLHKRGTENTSAALSIALCAGVIYKQYVQTVMHVGLPSPCSLQLSLKEIHLFWCQCSAALFMAHLLLLGSDLA